MDSATARRRFPTFSVYLEDAATRALDRIAQVRGTSRSALIREAVTDWLARQAADEATGQATP